MRNCEIKLTEMMNFQNRIILELDFRFDCQYIFYS